MPQPTAAKFSLSSTPSKPPPKVKYIRPPKEPELTRRDRQLIADANTHSGSYDAHFMTECQPINEDERWFRHHNWKEKRALVRSALASAGTAPRQLENFDNCGAECVIEWSVEENRYRLRGSYCHSRHCEPCMKAKANLLANNLRERLEANKDATYRFLTLTLQHRPSEPLADQIKRLYAAWRSLRSTDLWKHGQSTADKLRPKSRKGKTRAQVIAASGSCGQRGGSASLEVKWSKQGGWHAHLHIVSEGNYLNVGDLRSMWMKITAGSYVVNIKALNTTKDVSYYVAKYVTKGTNIEVWENPDAAQQWVTATKGVRTCATFGTWRGFKLLKKPKDKGGWKPVALLRTVAAKARQGDVASIVLLEALRDSFQYDPGKRRTRSPEQSEKSQE